MTGLKVSFIVDGVAEVESLPMLLKRLADDTQDIYPKPLLSGLQPKATPRSNAAACRDAVAIHRRARSDLIVILLDRERQATCPAQRAVELRAAVTDIRRVPHRLVDVVIKDSTFENRLISDLSALRDKHSKRFNVSNQTADAVVDNADGVDALELLKRCTHHRDFRKIKDSKAILRRADPSQMARNSRSFARFLRVLGHPAYREHVHYATQLEPHNRAIHEL